MICLPLMISADPVLCGLAWPGSLRATVPHGCLLPGVGHPGTVVPQGCPCIGTSLPETPLLLGTPWSAFLKHASSASNSC